MAAQQTYTVQSAPPLQRPVQSPQEMTGATPPPAGRFHSCAAFSDSYSAGPSGIGAQESGASAPVRYIH
ncbi:hypothetical protein NXW71_17230 [Parabacteroides merdae]|nr:hypothetical protein [Parabacteroides merdae]